MAFVGLSPRFAPPTAFLRPSKARALTRCSRAPHFRELLSVPRHTHPRLPLLLTATGIAGIALGFSSTVHCDDVQPAPASPSLAPPPKSSVNAYELTFGTVCGLCAGVFVKKSARMVAFLFGGLFVVLQVDWAQMASRFENLFYTTDAVGNRKPPTIRSIWRWVVDFLTADFQPRASFVAGLALGLRVG